MRPDRLGRKGVASGAVPACRLYILGGLFRLAHCRTCQGQGGLPLLLRCVSVNESMGFTTVPQGALWDPPAAVQQGPFFLRHVQLAVHERRCCRL